MGPEPEEIVELVARVAGDLRVTRVTDVREGTRSVSADVSLTLSSGRPIQGFLKIGRDDPDCFRRESEAARWLAAKPDLGAIGPRLLLVDEASRLIVWERLENVRSLEEILRAAGESEATRALFSTVDLLAALHVGTADLVLPGDSALKERASVEAEALRDGAPRIVALFDRLGVRYPDELHDLIETVARAHVGAGPLLSLTHGDQAPSNVLWSGERAWLVDFEFAALRPMLYDLATWITLCPLPETVVAAMRARYRARVARGVPEAGTSAFERNWGLTCAFRALSMATWFGPALVDADAEWGRGWRARSALVIALERAADACVTRDLASLQSLLGALAHAARDAWVVEPLVWPALESPIVHRSPRERASGAIVGDRPPS